MKRRSFIFALLCAISSANAFAGRDKVVLVDGAHLKALCDSDLHSAGFYCHEEQAAVIDAVAPDQRRYSPNETCQNGVRFESSELGLLDRLANTPICADLFISERKDDDGSTYYQAQISVFATNQYGEMPLFKPQYEAEASTHLKEVMPIADVGSDDAGNYLAKIDEAARRLKAAEDAKIVAKKAEEDYEKTPEYHRKQAQADLDMCQKRIVYFKQILEDDDQVAAISGYHDVQSRQMAAIVIVQCQRQIAIDKRILASH